MRCHGKAGGCGCCVTLSFGVLRKGCCLAALLCFGQTAVADDTNVETHAVVACILAAEVEGPSLRGRLRDACLMQAGDLCKSGAAGTVAVCYSTTALSLSDYVDRIVPLLPETIASREGHGLSYPRVLRSLRKDARTPQGCMVPSIATVSVEVRRGLCDVQRSYGRLKLALDAARLAQIALP